MNVDKCKEVNLLYVSKERMNKEKKNDGTKQFNPYFDKVTKKVSVNVKLSKYTKRVINEGTKDGFDMSNWVTEKPKGKTPISYCVLENDTDTTIKYVGFEPIQNFSKPKIEYYFEGTTIEKHLFNDWRIKNSGSEKQPMSDKDQVMWRTLDLSNLLEFTLDSTRYIVEGN
jgi:hypothetical protein